MAQGQGGQHVWNQCCRSSNLERGSCIQPSHYISSHSRRFGRTIHVPLQSNLYLQIVHAVMRPGKEATEVEKGTIHPPSQPCERINFSIEYATRDLPNPQASLYLVEPVFTSRSIQSPTTYPSRVARVQLFAHPLQLPSLEHTRPFRTALGRISQWIRLF